MHTNPSLAQHYGQMLKLIDPWIVSEVDLDTENLRLKIRVHTTKGAKLPCPSCGRLCSKLDHREERVWRHLDTMQFETLIVCRIPRVDCPEHGVLSATVPWADAYSRFTLLFEHFAIDVLRAAKSITAAMKLLRLSWDQIHAIQEQAVNRGLSRRANDKINHLGLDEKSFLAGHSYASVLTDLDQGRVLEVVAERTEAAAVTLLQTLSKEQRTRVKAVAMDMWPAFMQAARTILPDADIVHDKYHVAAYLGQAVDAVRRKEHRELSRIGNDALKGTRYLWLRRPDHWNASEQSSFRALAVEALKVGRAWSIKESFRHFWNYRYHGSACRFFRSWYFWATHSKLKPVAEVAKILYRHLAGLLAYLKHHITNAVAEGLNSKIQTIKANARGFRNFLNYRVTILFHCGKLNLYP